MIIMIFDRFTRDESEEIISDEEFISRKEFKKLKRLINAHQYHIDNVYMFYNLEPTPILKDMLDLSYGLLAFFDNVCRSHDILYWIDDDTLLNVIRNGQLMAFSEKISVAVMKSDLNKLNDAVKLEIGRLGLNNLKYDHDKFEMSLVCPEIEVKLLSVAISSLDDIDGSIVKSSKNNKTERNNVFPLDEIHLNEHSFMIPAHPNDYLRQLNGKNYIKAISELHDSGKLNQLKSNEDILKSHISILDNANENFE